MYQKFATVSNFVVHDNASVLFQRTFDFRVYRKQILFRHVQENIKTKKRCKRHIVAKKTAPEKDGFFVEILCKRRHCLQAKKHVDVSEICNRVKFCCTRQCERPFPEGF